MTGTRNGGLRDDEQCTCEISQVPKKKKICCFQPAATPVKKKKKTNKNEELNLKLRKFSKI